MALPQLLQTHHCLCSTLLFATTGPISHFSARKCDDARILQISTSESLGTHSAVLTEAIVTDAEPVMFKLPDGFEKRYLSKCQRCGLTVGYLLDWSMFDNNHEGQGRREDVAYLLQNATVVCGSILVD